MRLFLALTFASLLLPATASAQAERLPPQLILDEVATADRGPIPLEPALTALVVPWIYRFDNALSAPAAFGDGNVTLHWTLDCGDSGVRLVDPPVTLLAFVPNQAEYRGTATLPVTAAVDTPGQVALPCTLDAHASAAVPSMQTNASAAFQPEAAFRGEIRVAVAESTKKAGPQKMIYYEVVVENLGNSATKVEFEVEGARGKWQTLPPDPLVLEPGETDAVSLMVATPYDNGYTHDRNGFVLRATPVSPHDETLAGPPQELEVHAVAQGWYVPGASPFLVLGVLALAALVVRRRRAR